MHLILLSILRLEVLNFIGQNSSFLIKTVILLTLMNFKVFLNALYVQTIFNLQINRHFYVIPCYKMKILTTH